jgi:hypothetical protein
MADLYYHGLEGISVLTADNEDSDYPVLNLKDRNKHTLYKPGTSDLTCITLTWASPIVASSLAIINNNCPTTMVDAGDGILLWSSTLGTFTGDDVTEHVGAEGAYHAPETGEDDIWLETFDEISTDKYWELWLSGHTDALYMGTVLLGAEQIGSVNPDAPRIQINQYGHSPVETPGGIIHLDRKYDLRRRWTFQYTQVAASFRDDVIDTMWADTLGGHYPCVLKDIDGDLFWVSIANAGSISQTEGENKLWAFTLNLEEEL